MPMRYAILLLLASCAYGQALAPDTSFLVKLSDPVGLQASRRGAPVGAVIISPERFLGGRFVGSVQAIAADRVEIAFHRLEYKGRTVAVGSTVTEFVNSLGHPSVDERERPVKVDNGAFVSTHPDMLIDEGAELKMKVSPAKP
jgi:hypothetical protein